MAQKPQQKSENIGPVDASRGGNSGPLPASALIAASLTVGAAVTVQRVRRRARNQVEGCRPLAD
eukprot:CAMPEP_0179060496 /NCGR_PEP_ID=MMETSP0796-20121207/25897_1 /TAXON_ID=73915 /ORGANISM="Pyrodinium bahamense, Strain pbaha01" /LENGTH=63 /DNA_ID=CAMNT_0020757283 /DNA_START=8 /DNA_END=196 /DNA_ORIENTATION=+